MAKNSKIEWTDHTFNPWRGCTKVSDGCKNCYAANMGRRFGVDWGPGVDRVPASEAMWRQPYRWHRAAEKAGVRRRVFCASMADVFDDHPSILPEWRDRLWQTIWDTSYLDWILLTKRPENLRKHLPLDWERFSNVWLGVSAENQKTANERIPILRDTVAKVRFLSMEPLLEKVVITDDYSKYIDWVICGGETGSGARPMDPAWASSLQKRCSDLGVPFFFKSTGGRNKTDLLDGRTWQEFPE